MQSAMVRVPTENRMFLEDTVARHRDVHVQGQPEAAHKALHRTALPDTRPLNANTGIAVETGLINSVAAVVDALQDGDRATTEPTRTEPALQIRQ